MSLQGPQNLEQNISVPAEPNIPLSDPELRELVEALGGALLLLEPSSDGRYVSEDWLAFKALWNDKFLPAVETARRLGFDAPQLQPAVERPEATTVPVDDLLGLMQSLGELAPLLRRSSNFKPIMDAEQALTRKYPSLLGAEE